ncbi:Rrf2 family transcriptional regulator [Lentisphaerota bacterium WC36G]|nr:Rrf2 family transcriptional regulator [Lentisphaerae bacterium WC36]
MSTFVKISEGVSLAMHSMLLMALNENGILTTKDIAKKLDASATHLAKVIQRLNNANLVESTRGPKGGSRLARPKEDITLLEIFEAIEGKYYSPKCLLNETLCEEKCCLMGELIGKTNEQIAYELATRTLADVAKNS